LEFVARYGVVPREVVAAWAGTAKAATAGRERRLRMEGLIEVGAGLGGSGRLLHATRDGLAAVGRKELRVPRPSAGAVRHEAAVARVGIWLEAGGHRVLSERELLAAERVEGRRIYSVRTGERLHRPDLVVIGERPEAVEVELTPKAPRRLDVILRAWARAVASGQYEGVRYLCPPVTLRLLQRALARTNLGERVTAGPLPVLGQAGAELPPDPSDQANSHHRTSSGTDVAIAGSRATRDEASPPASRVLKLLNFDSLNSNSTTPHALSVGQLPGAPRSAF